MKRLTIEKREGGTLAPCEMKIGAYRPLQRPSSKRELRFRLMEDLGRCKAFSLIMLCSIVGATLGCGGDGGAVSTDQPPAETPESDNAPVREPESPPTAVESARMALDAARECQPDRLWERLPKTYRNDVSDVVHRFATKLDADRWTKTFALLERTATVMKSRGPAILDDPTLDGTALAAVRVAVPDDSIRENWAGITETLGILARSELADPDKLRTLDVETFLSGTGRTLLEPAKPFFAPLDDVTIEPVSADGDRAILRIEGSQLETRDHEYVLVEGRWVPATVHAAWDESLESARRAVDGLTVDTDAWDEALLTWESQLEVLESNPTPEPDGRITVVVTARLTLDDEERLQILLNAAAADPDLAVSIPQREGEETHFEVSAAGPIEPFADRLGRADGVVVTSIDAATSTVTVEIELSAVGRAETDDR